MNAVYILTDSSVAHNLLQLFISRTRLHAYKRCQGGKGQKTPLPLPPINNKLETKFLALNLDKITVIANFYGILKSPLAILCAAIIRKLYEGCKLLILAGSIFENFQALRFLVLDNKSELCF